MGGAKAQHIIYIVDFGLAKRYRDVKSQEHIPYSDNKDITGTVRYVSVNTHNGIDQSRRDDLESLIYSLIYLYKGKLIWQGQKIKDKEKKAEEIKRIKSESPLEEICKDCPEEFVNFLSHCRNLKFEQKPDYEYLRKQFRDAFTKNSIENDYLFDWFVQKKPITSKENGGIERRRFGSIYFI